MSRNAELELRPLKDKELETVSGGFTRGFFNGENVTFNKQDYQNGWNTVLQLTGRKT
jgi:hypothetical protein